MKNITNCINLGVLANPEQFYCNSKKPNYCANAVLERVFDTREDILSDAGFWTCNRYKLIGTKLYELMNVDMDSNLPKGRQVGVICLNKKIPDLVQIMKEYDSGEELDFPNLDDIIE